ncbi:hypothetical protein Tco_0345626 [Tanacetum coccineum]
MANFAWIEAMQEELYQFDGLDVWELVDRPLYKNVINMKWLWKNKCDEENTITRNKARLVAKGYSHLLSKYDIVTGLPKLKFVKDRLCSSCELGKAKYSLSPGPQSQENVPQAVEIVTTLNELDLLFSLMFDELLNGTTQVVSKYSAITTVGAPNQCQQQHTTPSTLTTIAADTPPLNIETTPETQVKHQLKHQLSLLIRTLFKLKPIKNMHKLTKTNLSTSLVHRTCWTKDHSLEQVIGNPSQSIRIRCQLETNGEMCMFALTVIRTEPKNIKETMADFACIEAMQEELHQFDGLDIWELVDRPLYKNVINMKWLWKNKRDEENTITRNKARLVAKGYSQQMDVKTTFLNGHLKEEVYINQQSLPTQEDIVWTQASSKGVIHQSPHGIFINQAKYAQEILKKHGMTSCNSVGTPIATKPLDADLSGTPVDQMKYRQLKSTLGRLNGSFGTLRMPLIWDSGIRSDTGFELTAFLDLDYAGSLDSRKSTSGGIQFLGGDKLVSWSSKKQDYYGFHFDRIPMYCDSKAAITISYNPVQYSRTKHIDVRYHFIKEHVENGIFELFFVGTEYQLADMFTKALPEDSFKYLVKRLGMRCLTPEELEVLANESA